MNANSPPRKRPLTAEEAELWAFAMREAKALRRVRERHEAPAIRSPAAAAPETPPPPPAVSAKPSGKAKGAAPLPSTTPPKHQLGPATKSPPPLAPYNERERRKLARDTDLIDAKLDLHGMRQREAHSALKRFLLACLSRSDRHVLVITGKGAPDEGNILPGEFSPQERGVLRRLVPQWLAESDLRGLVVSYTTASARHGGDGALYVRLRKTPMAG